jgi:hypothetical protein
VRTLSSASIKGRAAGGGGWRTIAKRRRRDDDPSVRSSSVASRLGPKAAREWLLESRGRERAQRDGPAPISTVAIMLHRRYYYCLITVAILAAISLTLWHPTDTSLAWPSLVPTSFTADPYCAVDNIVHGEWVQGPQLRTLDDMRQKFHHAVSRAVLLHRRSLHSLPAHPPPPPPTPAVQRPIPMRPARTSHSLRKRRLLAAAGQTRSYPVRRRAVFPAERSRV